MPYKFQIHSNKEYSLCFLTKRFRLSADVQKAWGGNDQTYMGFCKWNKLVCLLLGRGGRQAASTGQGQQLEGSPLHLPAESLGCHRLPSSADHSWATPGWLPVMDKHTFTSPPPSSSATGIRNFRQLACPLQPSYAPWSYSQSWGHWDP